eukprot:326150-Chlamydomonas_euryale.AAC.3
MHCGGSGRNGGGDGRTVEAISNGRGSYGQRSMQPRYQRSYQKGSGKDCWLLEPFLTAAR